MTALRPITIRAAEDLETVRSMVGGVITAVRYRCLPTADGSSYTSVPGRFDADLAAVELELEQVGARMITRAMDGPLEGIVVLGHEHRRPRTANNEIDVTSTRGWRDHVGEPIVSIAGSWHVSADGCPEALWALRLTFASGSVVIALGAANHELSYMPDELVVIWAEPLARAYHPDHAPDSAWGRPLPQASARQPAGRDTPAKPRIQHFKRVDPDGTVAALARIRDVADGIAGEYYGRGEWHTSNGVMRYLSDPGAGEPITEAEAEQVRQAIDQQDAAAPVAERGSLRARFRQRRDR